jgi:hypothetical protein
MLLSDELKPVFEALQAGNRAKAKELLKPILQAHPSADAWYLAANAADEMPEAIDCLNKALALDPNHAESKAILEKLKASQAAQTGSPVAVPTAGQQPIPVVGAGAAGTKPPPAPLKPPSEDNVYEMLWDCKFCGTKKLLGFTQKHCPNCGGQQDPSWRYYPSDSEKIAVKDQIYVGADKICPACQSLNGAKSEFCGNCGAPLTAAAEAKRLQDQQKAQGQSFETEDLAKRQRQEFEQSVGGRMRSQDTPKRSIKPWQIILAVVGLLICGGVLATVFLTKDVTVSVSGHRWERAINIEQLKPESGRVVGTCGSAPIDAYNRSQRTEQVGSRQVPDGQECSTRRVDRGNGTFKEEQECHTKYRSEPVYGPVCYYTVDRWGVNRSVKAQGDLSTPVNWPPTNITSSCNSIGCEREGNRSEKYVLIFTQDSKKTFECAVPVEQWQNAKVESRFTVKQGVVLGDPRCDTLKPVG